MPAQVIKIRTGGVGGAPGTPGQNGISAVNNVINPVLENDTQFNAKTPVVDLGYDMASSVTLTYEVTLIVKGVLNSTVVVHVEGPASSIVGGVLSAPFSVAPTPSGNSMSVAISASDKDTYVLKLSGYIRNGNTAGRVSIYAENLDDTGGYVARGSFAAWSTPVFTIIGGGTNTGGSGTGDLTKAQADLIYASKSDTRLTDSRTPLDRSVNDNKIAPGGLSIVSIDSLRNELDSRVKTINGTSPDSMGNINVAASGTVSGISETQGDARYARLNDSRLTDQRVPLDNSVINGKVPNAALDVSKINGLPSLVDSLIAQIANLSARLQSVEQNGATPGGGNVGTGYPAVYTTTY